MQSRENNLANMLDVNIWFSVCTGIYQESVRDIRLRIVSKCCVVFVPSGKAMYRTLLATCGSAKLQMFVPIG